MRLNWKPSRVFYGWWIVGASFLIMLYTGGVIFYGFTAIFEPIADELGWSYTQISLGASLRGLEAGLLAPLMGVLVDRWGPRRLIFVGGIITALGLLLLSRVTSLGMFYGAFFLVALGMSTTTMTVLMTTIANWFRRNVGIASGIASSGYGFGGLLIPIMVTLIDRYDWRMTIAILAVGMLIVILPLALLFRHKPEQYGYLPDGEVKGAVVLDNGLAPRPVVEIDVRAKQAFKSSAFWHMALAFTGHVILLSAVSIHVMPYLSSFGVAKTTAGLVATAIPLMSIGGRLGLGWLGDKYNRRRVMAGAFALMSLGGLCFEYARIPQGTWLLVPFLILFGVGYGGISALRPPMTRELFGRSNFGSIFGAIMGISLLGNMIGAPLAGWVFDTWGSYQGIWLVFAGLAAAALVSILTTPAVSTRVPPVI